HLLETIKPKVPVKRMVFHEITKPAIQAAVASPRDIDRALVNAYEYRRILDRLYGYEVSPVLWKKVMPKLSAGRVQSVATRIVVERERERMRFTSASYWDISATMDAGEEASPRNFGARLIAVDGSRLATGRDFASDGTLQAKGDVRVLAEADARRLAEALKQRDFKVASVEEKPYTRKPYAPFMTSTLQQEAGRKMRFTSERTMRIAQKLYENGYITYMRTDSTTLSVRIVGNATSGEECTFAASGRTITFAGFLKAYVEAVDTETGGEADDKQSRLPVLEKDQALTASELNPDGHTTSPPARYSE